jgi:hypothetical protein
MNKLRKFISYINYRVYKKLMHLLNIKKMNIKLLKADLNSKCPGTYFYQKLFKRDTQVYQRRTFGDLFLYYRKYGVTEKMLLKALVEAGFSTYRCPDIKDYVWFKYGYREYRCFIRTRTSTSHKHKVLQKYNFDYINNLYSEVFKK